MNDSEVDGRDWEVSTEGRLASSACELWYNGFPNSTSVMSTSVGASMSRVSPGIESLAVTKLSACKDSLSSSSPPSNSSASDPCDLSVIVGNVRRVATFGGLSGGPMPP